MKMAETKHCPDVPELQEALTQCVLQIGSTLLPLLKTTDMNVFINALTVSLMEFSTLMCETNEQFDQVIECVCHTMKMNSRSVQKSRSIRKKEIENE